MVGIMGLSIVGGLLAYQIYSAAVKTQVTPEQVVAIKPIDGSINEAIIESLRKRTIYTEEQIQQFLMAVVSTEIPVATVSAGKM